MADDESTLKHHSQLPDKKGATEFWDFWEKRGTWRAILWLHNRYDGDLLKVRAQVPYLVQAGNARGIDMLTFLKEFEGALDAPKEETNEETGQQS